MSTELPGWLVVPSPVRPTNHMQVYDTHIHIWFLMFQDERKLIVAQGRVYDEEVLYDSIHPVQSRHWHSYSVSVGNHHKCTL